MPAVYLERADRPDLDDDEDPDDDALARVEADLLGQFHENIRLVAHINRSRLTTTPATRSPAHKVQAGLQPSPYPSCPGCDYRGFLLKGARRS